MRIPGSARALARGRRRPRRRRPGCQRAFVLSTMPLAGAPRATGEAPALPGVPSTGSDCKKRRHLSQDALKLVPFRPRIDDLLQKSESEDALKLVPFRPVRLSETQ